MRSTFSILTLCVVLVTCTLPAVAQSTEPMAEFQYRMGKDNWKEGKVAEAQMSFTRAIGLDDRYAEAYVDRGNTYIAQNNWDKAIADFTRALELAKALPASADNDRIRWRAYTSVANGERHNSRWQMAIDDYTTAIGLDATKPAAYFGRAYAYLNFGKKSLSDADFIKYAELSGETEQSFLDKAEADYNADNVSSALGVVRIVLLWHPKSDRAYALRGECLLDSDVDGAADAYHKAVDINPKNAQAWAGLGKLATDAGDEKKAKKYLDSALKANPSLPIVYIRLGCYEVKFRSDSEAIKYFTKAIELDPKMAIAYYDRATVYMAQHSNDDALADLTAALKITPNNKETLNNRGIVYNRLEKYDLAIADLIRATEVDPTYSSAFYNLSTAYKLSGDYTKALASVNRTREIAPDDAEAADLWTSLLGLLNIDIAQLGNHANELYEKGEYEASIKEYTQLLEYDPISEGGHYNRGLCYAFLHLNDKATADYQFVTRYNPKNAQAHLELGRLAWVKNDNDTAIPELEKAIELAPTFANAYVFLGSCYSDKKQYAKAWGLFAKAIELEPRNVDAYYYRANSYRTSQQWHWVNRQRALQDCEPPFSIADQDDLRPRLACQPRIAPIWPHLYCQDLVERCQHLSTPTKHSGCPVEIEDDTLIRVTGAGHKSDKSDYT